MGKPSTYALLLQAQRQIAELRGQIELMKAFTIQQCEDMAIITLNQDHGFGPKRNQEFKTNFRETFLAYAKLCVEDGSCDEEIVYTKAKVDEALREALGPDVLPFDERYDIKNLYSRKKAEEKE